MTPKKKSATNKARPSLNSFIAKIKNRKIKIEHVFLIVGSIVGLTFVFLTPPIAVVDEENHFFRAYELSKGNIYTDSLNNSGLYGANIPENMAYYVYYNKGVAIANGAPSKETIIETAKQKPSETSTREVVYNGSAAYSPAGYIPQTIGMFIARIADSSNEGYLYLGRLFNLLAFILAAYFAIKIIPIGKSVLFVVALLPTTLYQAASLSLDTVLIAAVFLATSLSMLVLFRDKFPTKKILFVLFAAIVFIALTKYIYLLMFAPILIYWVFTRQRKERLRATISMAVIFVSALLLLIAWNSQLSSDVTASAGVLEANAKVISVSGQLEYIFSHPLAYIKSIIDLFFFDTVSGDVILRGMIGRYGWLGGNFFAPLVSMVIGFAALFLAAFIDKKKRQASIPIESRKHRLTYLALFTFAALLAVVGVVTGLYVAFTSVGSDKILGVQGRYFIPVLPVLIMGFIMLRSSVIKIVNTSNAQKLLYGMVIFNLVYAAATITKGYY